MTEHRINMNKLNEKLSGKYFNTHKGVFYINLSISQKSSYIQEDYISRTAQTFQSKGQVQLKNLFMGLPEEKSPRILLYGSAGSGKSTTSQTIAYQWGCKELLNNKFDFIFYFECRQLTSLIKQGRNMSLEELIHHNHWHDTLTDTGMKKDLYQYVTQHQERILFIIDGLDELFHWDLVVNDKYRIKVLNMKAQAEIPVVLYNLIYGSLLYFCKVLVTSRPTETINTSLLSRVIVALGFDEDAIDECSFAVCDYERDIHEYITDFLLHRPQLYVHCVVPINCVLLTAILYRDKLLGREEDDMIDRLSQLTTRIILDIIHKRSETQTGGRFLLGETQQRSVRALAALAADGMLSSKIIFDGADLRKYNLKASGDNTLSGLLDVYTDTDISNIDSDQVITASFLHLSIQEFLAAVHICLTWKKLDVRKVAIVDPKSRRLDNVQLYTAGLLGDTKYGHRLLQALDHRPGNNEQLYMDQVKEYVKSMKVHSGELTKLTKLQMIRCAHESGYDGMVDEVARAVLKDTNKDPVTGGHIDTVDLSDIDGGLLPHHLSSIGYFIDQSKCVEVVR